MYTAGGISDIEANRDASEERLVRREFQIRGSVYNTRDAEMLCEIIYKLNKSWG